MKKATCVYIIDAMTGSILMAKKTRKVGVGKWFGYGGKIEEGQTPEDCTIEETFKETNGVLLKRDDLERVALIDFHNGETFSEPTMRVLFYRIIHPLLRFPENTEEMVEPTLFSSYNLPFDEMMPGDKLFIPQVINGECVKGYIHFTEDKKKTVYSYKIVECSPEELVL